MSKDKNKDRIDELERIVENLQGRIHLLEMRPMWPVPLVPQPDRRPPVMWSDQYR